MMLYRRPLLLTAYYYVPLPRYEEGEGPVVVGLVPVAELERL